jgi:hypothetical protein
MPTSEQTEFPLLPEDRSLLVRVRLLSGISPCYIPKVDLRRLMELAGYDHDHLLYRKVVASADPVRSWIGELQSLVATAEEGAAGE